MPGDAEDKVTAFSFVQHGCLAQETHFRGGNLRFQPEVGGTRAGKIRVNRPAAKKKSLSRQQLNQSEHQRDHHGRQ